MEPEDLPIAVHLPKISGYLGERETLVLIAPPGAGKTTALPPFLMNAPWLKGNRIIVSQPRRVAARAAAARVAATLGVEVGGAVGYAVRQESRQGKETQLLYCTEGVLTNILQADPFLTGIGAIIFDEFHERSLESDLALALANEIRKEARPDLRLIVCSATLDPGPAAEFLNAGTIEVSGRAYPVDVRYLDRPAPEKLEEAVSQGVRSLWGERPGGKGDLLVFLPGAGEIRRAAEMLAPWAEGKGVSLVPLHGDLPPDAQDRAIGKSEGERVILATNVAETSLTIESVTGVVDSGLAKLMQFDPSTRMDRLALTRISKASANQRAGRAGRTGPGVALRLWTRHDDAYLPERIPPEIHRADLSRAVLELSAWGCTDPLAFGWFEKPEEKRLAEALNLLKALKALNADGSPTREGVVMLSFPLHPRLSRMLLAASALGLGPEASALASVLSERDLALSGRAFGEASQSLHHSDALLRMELLEQAERYRFASQPLRAEGIDPGAARSAARERDRLKSLLGKPAKPFQGDREEALLRLIYDAYPDRVAKLDSGDRYLLADGRAAKLHQKSAVKGEEWITALKLDLGGRGPSSQAQILWGSKVKEEWLKESGHMRTVRETLWDRELQKVFAQEADYFGNLLLKARPQKPDPETASALLLAQAVQNPLAAMKPGEKALALLGRITFLSNALGGEQFPPWNEDSWRALLGGMAEGKASFNDLRNQDLSAAVNATLDHRARKLLREEAPETLQVPSGRQVEIHYPETGPPFITVKIQEMFGSAKTPRLALGRVPLVVHLVGPSGRPLQVTADLESFWKNGYPEVIKEMRGRYPKHYWPENPWEAVATVRTVKKSNPALQGGRK